MNPIFMSIIIAARVAQHRKSVSSSDSNTHRRRERRNAASESSLFTTLSRVWRLLCRRGTRKDENGRSP
jgi:hypothetical protein